MTVLIFRFCDRVRRLMISPNVRLNSFCEQFDCHDLPAVNSLPDHHKLACFPHGFILQWRRGFTSELTSIPSSSTHRSGTCILCT
jgi:hypothetical protein